MAHVRVAYQAAPTRPILPNPQHVQMRPFLINHQAIPHVPIHHQPSVVVRRSLPQYLPVLQAPIFPRAYSFDEEEEQYHEEIDNYPTVLITDQHRTTAHQFPHRIPTFIPLKNYKRKSARHVKPNYSSYTYYNR